MPLNPPPTIENHLGLITQPISRGDTPRHALLTFAVNDSTSLGAQAVVDLFQGYFNGGIGTGFDTDCTVEKPTIKLGDGTNVPHEAIASGATVVGTLGNKVLPSNVAMIAKKTTGFGGKGNRGRTYYPWNLDDTVVSEVGVIASGTISAYNTVFQNFLSNLLAASIGMHIANKHITIPLPPLKPFVSSITLGKLVTSYVCEGTVATQRRRLGR